jgi:hypothetical protein
MDVLESRNRSASSNRLAPSVGKMSVRMCRFGGCVMVVQRGCSGHAMWTGGLSAGHCLKGRRDCEKYI